MNPELQRLLWLNISPIRLALIPTIIGLFVAACASSVGDTWPRVVGFAAAAMFALFTVAGGAHSSASSVTDEHQEDTWDQQRMSSLQPWTMTWGKLFGATAYHWYGGLFCLGLMAWAMHEHGLDWLVVLRGVVAAILFAVFAHASNLASSVLFANAQPRRLLWLIPLVLFVLFQQFAQTFLGDRDQTTTWWSYTMAKSTGLLLTMSLGAFCALVAAWRAMASALSVPQWPWGMPALTLVLSAYFLGFSSDVRPSDASSLIVALSLGLALLSVLSEEHARSRWQRMVNDTTQGQLSKAVKALPAWTILIALAMLGATVAIIFESRSDEAVNLARIKLQFGWAAVLTIARDCATALFFAFAAQARRARLSFVLYLFIAWILAPWLLLALTNEALPVEWMIPPAKGSNGFGSIIAACIHFSIAAGLLWWRWQRTRPVPLLATRPAASTAPTPLG